MSSEKSVFRWKGKIVTEKQYKRRVKQVEMGKKRKKANVTPESTLTSDEYPQCIVQGRRIVELSVMAQYMHCSNCKQLLAFENVENEVRQGLGSIFSIRCQNCLLMNFVPSGKQHPSLTQTKKLLFDVNSKAALGTLHAGLGFTAVNNFLSTMNIPNMSSKTFKKYEREVGPVVELVAKESCQEATKLERSLTIENYQELEKKLPEGFQSGFLIPKCIPSTVSSVPTESAAIPESQEHTSSRPFDKIEESNLATYLTNTPSISIIQPIQSTSQSMLTESSLSATDTLSSSFEGPSLANKPQSSSAILESPLTISNDVSFDDVVRLMFSYDMGYTTRGDGHSYDSLNGYGALIGSQSGLVLDYTTRNRKCKLCDKGHSKDDHDCRCNFKGSAKAMEAHAAVQLSVNSSIFKDNNVEVGVFTSDNDCSSIYAVRKECHHTILKRSDRNHTTKGVKNLLYKTANTKGVTGLTSDAINYLHRCFSYAVAQNEGNTEKMAAAIKSIPYHAYDDHEQCREWCGYLKDPENYKHTTALPEKFQNPQLQEELKKIFAKLADNAKKFSTLASTQANESLNGIMSPKAPKAISYSLSESADFRFGCAVSQKNKRHQYVQDVLNKIELSPGSYLSKHIERTTKSHHVRAKIAKKPEFKKRRQLLKKIRSQLKHSKELHEEDTYQSHLDLITMPDKENVDNNADNVINVGNLPQLSTNIDFEDKTHVLVFFDLEISGLKRSCEILQIAARYGNQSFCKYIDPKYAIPASASSVNGLTKAGCDMFLHGKKVSSYPLRIVLGEFLEFLNNCGKKCILIAHNCSFDAPRLVTVINEVHLKDSFSKVIEGFADTLPLFKKKFPGMSCRLGTLAQKSFTLNPEKMHDAIYDVIMLQNVAFLHLTANEIMSTVKDFMKVVELPANVQSLQPLRNSVSESIIKRMAFEGITYNLLFNIYKQGREKAVALLEKKDCNGKKVIRTKKILNSILSHFEQLRCNK